MTDTMPLGGGHMKMATSVYILKLHSAMKWYDHHRTRDGMEYIGSARDLCLLWQLMHVGCNAGQGQNAGKQLYVGEKAVF